MKRVDLIRFNQDRITKSIISLNLEEILANKSSDQNIQLIPGDEIRVYPETIFNTVKPVSIKVLYAYLESITLKRI